MADNKDTIYVDIDDEITALIDKVRGSSGRVVALVLPKRATVLQSVVNMKLLKRTADSEKKNIVLITSESGLLPLAGAVGIHVASSLNSKPEIPAAPSLGGSETETVEEDLSMPLDDEETPDLTKATGSGASIGALADAANRGGQVPSKANDSVETLELDNEEVGPEEVAPETAAVADEAVKAPKVKKDKHLKVPNFDRFRVLLILGVLTIIGLIVLGYFAFAVWPHATIDIKTNASTVNTSANLTLDPQAFSANLASGDIPAKSVTQQKTFSQTVNTTGQKNEGTLASGSVTMSASDCNLTYQGAPSFTIPSGTGLSYNSLTYITQADTQMVYSGFKNNCFEYTSSGSTNISAQSPGSQYNATITNATVAGFAGVAASGSASGGTDNIVQVVAQADISTATSKINASNSSALKTALSNELRGEGLYPIEATFTSSSPQIASNPNVGTAANTVTVTETVTYTMYGAKMSDLQAVLASNIHSQTSKNQNIINYGINQSAFKQSGTSGSTDEVSLSALATVGPNISVNGIKQQSAGKSPQAIISSIKNNPDVTSVTVKLNPFWVSTAPTNTAKITVNIAKPGKSA